MSIWTFVKILAGLAVLVVMALSGMLAYHVSVRPLGGIFSKLIPAPVQTASGTTDEDLMKMLDSDEMPDIDPGEKYYQKSQELLALGKLPEAREKLTAIVNVFPSSASAPAARRIVGEINLDELLSSSHMEGKTIYTVKRGDSLLGIAAKNHTTIENMIHINSLLELRGIQPGDEFVLMPLELRLLIEPKRKSLSVWDGGRFIKEYQLLQVSPGLPTHRRANISKKFAELDGKKVLSTSGKYPASDKCFQIDKPSLLIRSWDGLTDQPSSGILMKSRDMEELNLLIRVGNEVEFR